MVTLSTIVKFPYNPTMKVGWLVVIAGSIAAAVFAYSPDRVSQLAALSQRTLKSLAFQRELHVRGNKVLKSSEVEALLPTESNNFWWILNSRVIEAEAVKSPLISAAIVRRCRWYSFRCFVVELSEREPGFAAVVGDTRWLVATDGTYISPIPKKAQYQDGVLSTLPVVNGLVPEGGSPDLFKARFRFMKELLDLIYAELGLNVSEVEIAPGAEMNLLFKGFDFRARFDNSFDDIGRVREEILRLRKLLLEFKGREHLIQEVDLAFNKVAVVRLKNGSAQP